jgi:alkylhydroperoxidase family enzyme
MDSAKPTVRIPPARRPPLATVVAALAGRTTHTEPHRIFTTLARHRRLFRRWLPLGDLLLLRGDLQRRDAELLILRTAWNCGCWYVWVQHAGLAVSHGLSPAVVDAIPDRCAGEACTPRQRRLLDAADELHRDRVITDATWAALAAEMRDTELIEMCILVGHYEMLAMTVNSLGVQPEPSAVRALSARAAHTADVLSAALRSATAMRGSGQPERHVHHGDMGGRDV